MEQWSPIHEFPGYAVSNLGRVCNEEVGRMMTFLKNQHGNIHVGLTKNKRQYKRSVALLVANAFLEPPPSSSFDTPIHLDGNRLNNEAINLMWRPRWFAVKYLQQFENGKRGFRVPIQEVKTGEKFANSWEAATKYGLLDREIATATLNRTYVWPTFQEFRTIG